MAVNVSGIRRNLKNLAHNYSEAQVKVREATSNDPWGPSSTLMSEIADMTHNLVSFSEIMQMIWKRLNDHGKNWRHVYKALVLLDYLIKTGNEKVAEQCRENIYVILTLKDFYYFEENKDQGMNIREKAKQLVTLLKDSEKLKNERIRAIKAKESLFQCGSAMGSDSNYLSNFNMRSSPNFNKRSSELETARPQTAGEEELQLQLAIAMSKEEADQEEKCRKSDDLRLKMALTQSQEDFKRKKEDEARSKQSAILDLMELNLDPMPLSDSSQISWQSSTLMHNLPLNAQNNSWNDSNCTVASNETESVLSTNPWTPAIEAMRSANENVDPWKHIDSMTTIADPWLPADKSSSDINQKINSNSESDVSLMQENLSEPTVKKNPETFLGENCNLVNLDNLISMPTANQAKNPFGKMTPENPSINQLRSGNIPWVGNDGQFNPFLS